MRQISALHRVLGVILAVAILLVALPGVTAASSATLLATVLTGAEEVPGPGDPDGIGAAAFVLKPDAGKVCWAYAVKRIDPVNVAHIHKAPAGQSAPPAVDIGASGNRGFSVGCANASPAVLADIAANPVEYYFNVHTTPHPAGALRGQLD